MSHVSPYLGVTGLVSLAATSTSFRDLVFKTPHNFRHVDLTSLQSIPSPSPWRPRSSDDASSLLSLMGVDDFYARPTRRILYSLQWHGVLHGVRTLILDNVAVPAALAREILCEDAYNVRILSLRGDRDFSDEKLMQVLRYVMRPTRPQGTPKLKGLYYFTPLSHAAEFNPQLQFSDTAQGVTASVGAQLGGGTCNNSALQRDIDHTSWHQYDPWYSATGSVFRRRGSTAQLWAHLIEACEGSIAFDAVLCRRHGASAASPSTEDDIETALADQFPRLATISLDGCKKCGSCPEGPAYPGMSPESHLPLLVPPSLHSFTVKVAQRLDTRGLPHPPLILRCRRCLKDRWCEICNAWWCESCYQIPKNRSSDHTTTTPIGLKSDQSSIKVHNGLCVERCLMGEMLNGVGEGGMWG